jgi:hypothetical protein
MSFEKLGPVLAETRTATPCAVCGDFIYKRIYFSEQAENKQKVVFVCKNCLKNNK